MQVDVFRGRRTEPSSTQMGYAVGYDSSIVVFRVARSNIAMSAAATLRPMSPAQ